MEPSIECYELFIRLGDDEILVIDCRDGEAPRDLASLQIPGALRMGFDELAECLHILPDDELIVLYGCSGDGSESWRASALLRTRGRAAVCLQGGLPAWIARGYPTEPYVSSSERVARRRAQESSAALASEA